MTQIFTLQDLLDEGLPAISTDGEDNSADTQFSRDLTPTEWLTYLSIAKPKNYDDILRVDNLNVFLVSSGLAGRNLATINNNADRDNLLKAICFQLGLCDSLGIINQNYSPMEQPNSTPNNGNKNS